MAERLGQAALQQMGFDDAAQTSAGADEGLDVAGPTVAAQVKYTSTPIGRPVLQQLQGAAGGRITVCFSRSGYSHHALEYAESVGMALFVLTLPGTIRPVNALATDMAARVP
jgi:hypothetical protein